MMLRIDIHRWFAMVAILNPKWLPNYKNSPIWAKFGTMNINSHHHNLLENKISPKSEDFCIW
jgi:hypothetical protein